MKASTKYQVVLEHKNLGKPHATKKAAFDAMKKRGAGTYQVFEVVEVTEGEEETTDEGAK